MAIPLSETARNMMYSASGQVIFAAVLGLGLAGLFRRVCPEGGCIVLTAPPLEDVTNKTFAVGEKCFRFKEVQAECK